MKRKIAVVAGAPEGAAFFSGDQIQAAGRTRMFWYDGVHRGDPSRCRLDRK